ncbi:MAG TPA: hypothetical protein VJX74_05265 [Blastocatellia bacterium]|nr:hypothetical protein [Blastocatellia bacterium]
MANPLTAILPISSSASIADLLGALANAGPAIDAALTAVGTVHFARFVLFDASNDYLQPAPAPPWTNNGQFKISVITAYDGDFAPYIQAFVNQLGDVFNVLLSFTSDGQDLVPVQNNVAGFTAYVQSHDASQQSPNKEFGLYSAYPDCTVQKILTLPCAPS